MDIYLSKINLLKSWLIAHGVGAMYADWIKLAIVFALIAFFAWIANFIAKRIILTILSHIAKKSETLWDDILIERKVFHKLAHLAPAIVIFYTVQLPLAGYPGWLTFIQKASMIYMVVVSLAAFLAFIDSAHDIYLTMPMSKTRTIKGYLQVAKIILYTIAIIFVLHIIFEFNLGSFFTGLGAMTAVLMFIFKDTILGLVASIQLSANDMLRPGDWIEMPSRKADGVVQDINLTTVKVQNWDKTVTTIPTYILVSDSFTNWRGMEESEGRRIKKSINIDMKSVKFYNEEMFSKLGNDAVVAKNFNVKKYVSEASIADDKGNDASHRTMTNLGLFRAYLESYLKGIALIHPDMTQLVHYLQPGEFGLPIEMVAFSKEKAGIPYEKLQCDIYDHILAMLPLFELRVFQRPTGEDGK
ncbi:MAG TPA: mechanosensitive ion channel domain-containing protein [Bacteroidales bacterium]|nr:mechanosensitive ion channel domain-containing protein [Bacteroidales bacterium]